jgi:acyl-CoA thioester hydrolase
LTIPATASPLSLHHEVVRPEWVDYNGHMNVAYYVLIFDHATDAVLDYLDLGADYRAASGCSVFVAEAHVTYDLEVNAGDLLRINSRVLGVEGKKFILFHEMYRDNEIQPAATNEVLCLHVNMAERRSAPMPNAASEQLRRVAADHARLPKPTGAGRVIALNAGRPGRANRQ